MRRQRRTRYLCSPAGCDITTAGIVICVIEVGAQGVFKIVKGSGLITTAILPSSAVSLGSPGIIAARQDTAQEKKRNSGGEINPTHVLLSAEGGVVSGVVDRLHIGRGGCGSKTTTIPRIKLLMRT